MGNYTVGGLRIGSIVNYDKDGSLLSAKKYAYTMPDDSTRSSGFAKTNFSDVDYSTSVNTYFQYVCGIKADGSKMYCCGKRTAYLYYSDPIAGIFSSPVCYQYVKEYEVSPSGEDKGYTQYEYSVCEDDYKHKNILISNEWKRGDLLKKEVFRKNTNGTYSAAHQVENQYSLHPGFSNQAKGFKMVTSVDQFDLVCKYDSSLTLEEMYLPLNYVYESKWKHLDSTVVTHFFDGGEVRDTTIYHYNDTLHCKPYLLERLLSGKKLNTEYGYYLNTGLVDFRKETRGTSVVKEDSLFYNDDKQVREYREYSGGKPIKKVSYIHDDRKDLVQISKENDIPVSYIRGYYNQHIVAKIDNMKHAEIEANATLKGYLEQLDDFTDLTGANAKNNLTTINQHIRENIPDNATVFTYTYFPLKGMTSETDPSGRTIYYEYDGFGRLKYVKDHNGNILKKHDYHYAVQD